MESSSFRAGAWATVASVLLHVTAVTGVLVAPPLSSLGNSALTSSTTPPDAPIYADLTDWKPPAEEQAPAALAEPEKQPPAVTPPPPPPPPPPPKPKPSQLGKDNGRPDSPSWIDSTQPGENGAPVGDQEQPMLRKTAPAGGANGENGANGQPAAPASPILPAPQTPPVETAKPETPPAEPLKTVPPSAEPKKQDDPRQPDKAKPEEPARTAPKPIEQPKPPESKPSEPKPAEQKPPVDRPPLPETPVLPPTEKPVPPTRAEPRPEVATPPATPSKPTPSETTPKVEPTPGPGTVRNDAKQADKTVPDDGSKVPPAELEKAPIQSPVEAPVEAPKAEAPAVPAAPAPEAPAAPTAVPEPTTPAETPKPKREPLRITADEISNLTDAIKGSEPTPAAPVPTPRPPAPTVENTAKPGKAGPAGAAGELSADAAWIADKESDPTSLRRTARYESGRVEAGEGLEILTVNPQFDAATRNFSMPGSPVFEIKFDRNGDVKRLRMLRSSGFPNVNEPIKNAMFKWRARGKALDELPNDPDAGVVLRITIRLR